VPCSVPIAFTLSRCWISGKVKRDGLPNARMGFVSGISGESSIEREQKLRKMEKETN
jgi:hypothetical protein